MLKINHIKAIHLLPPVIAASVMAAFFLHLELFLDGVIIPAIVHADVAAPPYDWWPTDGYFTLFPVLGKMAELLPDAPVLGISDCLLNLIWLSAFVQLAIVIAGRYKSHLFIVYALSALSFLLVLSESIVFVIYTRSSIFLAASALLLACYDSERSAKKKWLYLSLFVLGIFARPLGAMLAIMFLFLFFLLKGMSLKDLFFRFRPQMVILGCALAFYYIDTATTKNFGKIFETEYEWAVVDRGDFVPIGEMENAVDSAKYIAVSQHMMITDSANIKIDFLKRMIRSEGFFNYSPTRSELVMSLNVLKEFVRTYSHILLSLAALVAVAWHIAARKKSLLLKMLALNLAFWMLMLWLSMSANMVNRIFSPMLATLFICSLLIFLEELSVANSRHRVFIFLLLPVFFISLGFDIARLQKDCQTARERESMYHYISKGIAELGRNNKVVMYSISEDFFSRDPFARMDPQSYRQAIFPDLFFGTYFQFGQQRIIDEYGFSPLDYEKLYRFFIDHQADLIFFMAEDKARFLEYYFKVVYGYPLSFTEVPQSYFPLPYKLYKISPAEGI